MTEYIFIFFQFKFYVAFLIYWYVTCANAFWINVNNGYLNIHSD